MGFEPTTLRSKGFDSTNSPPRPTNMDIIMVVMEICIHLHFPKAYLIIIDHNDPFIITMYSQITIKDAFDVYFIYRTLGVVELNSTVKSFRRIL